jgi:hypothetical protein
LKEIFIGDKFPENQSLVHCLQELDDFDSGRHGLRLGFVRGRQARVIRMR